MTGMDKGEFIKGGYTVRPAINGGWVVYDQTEPNLISSMAAFSTARDLLAWLTDEHDVLGRGENERKLSSEDVKRIIEDGPKLRPMAGY